MGSMQRTKGNAGEREAAAIIRDLTGCDVRRRVRQHDGDSDLIGVPGWMIEVKRHKAAGRADIAAWWRQAHAQAAGAAADVPVLLYRLDRDQWRAVWPVSVAQWRNWPGYIWTVEGSIEAWASVAMKDSA